MMKPVFYLSLGAIALLAACGPGGAPPADAPDAVAAPPPAVAADPGRGAALSARADAIEQRVLQSVAEQRMTPAQGQEAQAELTAARQTLSGMLAQTPGPLPTTDRMLIAQALDAVEARVE